MKTPTPPSEIAIVGGGLAGLHTAWRLQNVGIPWRLFEGRAELGGRVASLPDATGRSLGIDLGPSWFWPHQSRLRSLLQTLSLPWCEQYTAGAALFEQGPGRPPLRSEGPGAPVSYRISGGTFTLISTLSDRLDSQRIETRHVLREARRMDGHWHLSFGGDGGERTLRTDHLVLALPPRQAAKFLSTADLSQELIETLNRQQTWMSGQAKFVATYPTPFWRTAGLAGQAFSRVGPLVEIHDASPEPREPTQPPEFGALFGFLGVPALQRARLKEADLKMHCLRQLEGLFGPPAAQPDVTALKDWSREPLTATEADVREAPAHAQFPGQRFAPELASLKLWLAGSEFAAAEPGYLEGALEASSHVADSLESRF